MSTWWCVKIRNKKFPETARKSRAKCVEDYIRSKEVRNPNRFDKFLCFWEKIVKVKVEEVK